MNPAMNQLVSRPVCLLDLLTDPAAFADLHAMAFRPLPHAGQLAFIDLYAGTPPPTRAADLAGMGDELIEAVAEPVCIALGQVDLVLSAINGEADGRDGIRSVKVVLQD